MGTKYFFVVLKSQFMETIWLCFIPISCHGLCTSCKNWGEKFTEVREVACLLKFEVQNYFVLAHLLHCLLCDYGTLKLHIHIFHKDRNLAEGYISAHLRRECQRECHFLMSVIKKWTKTLLTIFVSICLTF